MILVDVELDDFDFAVEFLGDLFERRCDLPAGTAPFRPEIHHDGGGRLQYVGLEGIVGNSCSCHLFASPGSPLFGPPKRPVLWSETEPRCAPRPRQGWGLSARCGARPNQAALMGFP